MTDAIKEDIKNEYRHILFNEKRENIFHSKLDIDKEDDPQ